GRKVSGRRCTGRLRQVFALRHAGPPSGARAGTGDPVARQRRGAVWLGDIGASGHPVSDATEYAGGSTEPGARRDGPIHADFLVGDRPDPRVLRILPSPSGIRIRKGTTLDSANHHADVVLGGSSRTAHPV